MDRSYLLQDPWLKICFTGKQPCIMGPGQPTARTLEQCIPRYNPLNSLLIIHPRLLSRLRFFIQISIVMEAFVLIFSKNSGAQHLRSQRCTLVPEIAHMHKTDKAKYESTARSWTQKYGMG